MRKIIVAEFLTLDGVMEAPETWQFPFLSDDISEYIKTGILALDAQLLGRVTYETFAGYWPTQTHNEFGIADKLNSMPKFVVSTTLDKADWNNSMLIKKNVIEEITKLKQQPGGDIGITGSATLVEALMRADLIDEFQLQVYPLVLGRGKRLFNEQMDVKGLKLIDSRTFSSGVVALIYQPDRK